MIRFLFCFSAILISALSIPPVALAQGNPIAPAPRQLDTTPIRDLVHLVNTIIEENPDCNATIARLGRLDWKSCQDSCAPYIARNAENPRIAEELEALLSSPAYQLCFRQFTILTPDWYRKFVYGLPYIAVDGPGGGIGETLLELCRHRTEVAGWYADAVSSVDPARAIAIAQEWLPPGEYATPPTYFVYGMGGDAFAREGQVCFDLYSIVLGDRPASVRFTGLSEIGTERIERVLAHEFHHVFSEDMIYAGTDPGLSWQQRWRGRLVCALVSEGTAMHCDPRQGIEREVRRDTVVIRYWISSLNEKLAAVDAGSTSESDLRAWYDSTYHDLPRELLRDFLTRRFPDRDLDSLFAENASHRPDLTHTLGWWMVSRLSEGGQKERVMQLLSSPDSLFAWYNESAGSADQSLLIAPSQVK